MACEYQSTLNDHLSIKSHQSLKLQITKDPTTCKQKLNTDIQTHNTCTTPATQKTAAPHQSYFVAELPLTSMVVQKVPRLPRKSSLRCQSYFVAELPLTSMVVQKVPRLPRKSSLRCGKGHACHAQDRGAASVLLRRRASADIYDRGATSVLLRRQASADIMVVQKVPRLPRKSSLRCRKCHACHTKDRGATSAVLRRQASANIYGGTESTTPATQIDPEAPKVPRLPRKRPRRHISPTSSPSFR